MCEFVSMYAPITSDLEKQTASGFSFIHSRHDPLMVELEQIIRVNGQYSSVQSTEFNVQNPSQQTEMASTATTEKSVDRHCQTELGQTAVVQTEPEQMSDISALYSVVHKPSKKPVPKVYTQYIAPSTLSHKPIITSRHNYHPY